MADPASSSRAEDQRWMAEALAVAEEGLALGELPIGAVVVVDGQVIGRAFTQEATQGRVTPESWTHGSSEARMRWFLQGFKSGNLNQCDTFSVDSVN